MNTKVELAKALAFHYHKDQKYGEHPYSKHLEDVVMNVKLLTEGSDNLLCVAYLHDILEDTEIDITVIPALFGEEIFHAVCALTKPKAWGLEYEQYIERVVSDQIAIQVKYCDTLSNLTQSVRDGKKGRIDKYTKQLSLLAEYLDETLGEENE
jgi:(p)ppGpp synthase/HD superfamily hydrolase